jgi:hypothetical protein
MWAAQNGCRYLFASRIIRRVEGYRAIDSRKCQTLRVPRQSRGFTRDQLRRNLKIGRPVRGKTLSGRKPANQPFSSSRAFCAHAGHIPWLKSASE